MFDFTLTAIVFDKYSILSMYVAKGDTYKTSWYGEDCDIINL